TDWRALPWSQVSVDAEPAGMQTDAGQRREPMVQDGERLRAPVYSLDVRNIDERGEVAVEKRPAGVALARVPDDRLGQEAFPPYPRLGILQPWVERLDGRYRDVGVTVPPYGQEAAARGQSAGAQRVAKTADDLLVTGTGPAGRRPGRTAVPHADRRTVGNDHPSIAEPAADGFDDFVRRDHLSPASTSKCLTG